MNSNRFPSLCHTRNCEPPLLVTQDCRLSQKWIFHRADDTLFNDDPWFGGVLKCLLCCPLWSYREAERSLILLLIFKRIRNRRGQILSILRQTGENQQPCLNFHGQGNRETHLLNPSFRYNDIGELGICSFLALHAVDLRHELVLAVILLPLIDALTHPRAPSREGVVHQFVALLGDGIFFFSGEAFFHFIPRKSSPSKFLLRKKYFLRSILPTRPLSRFVFVIARGLLVQDSERCPSICITLSFRYPRY